MPKRYWYIALTYLLMHLSGLVGLPVLIKQFHLTLDEAIIYWNIISFFVATVIILYLLRKDMALGSDRNAAPASQVVLWSILGVFLSLISQVIAGLIEVNVLGIEAGSENTAQIMELARSIPLFVIVPTILAPILEEIVFRKVIFGEIYKRSNFVLAALLSSLIFGIIHGEPQHLLIYSSMGFVFAFLYVRTKRIIVPIIAHAAMNSITVYLQFSIDPEELEKMRQQLEEMMIFIGY